MRALRAVTACPPLACREKKLLVSSEDYGRDLTGVQNLRKKHKRLEAELATHEPAIQVGGARGVPLAGGGAGIGFVQPCQRAESRAQGLQSSSLGRSLVPGVLGGCSGSKEQ